MSRFDWMDAAACASHSPDAWFPSLTGKGGAAQARAAATVCSICTVTTQCSAFAKATGAAYGVWAGATKGGRPSSQGVSHGGPRKTRAIA